MPARIGADSRTSQPPMKPLPTGDIGSRSVTKPDIEGDSPEQGDASQPIDAPPRNVDEKAPVTSSDITGANFGRVGLAGFEPTTSCTPSKRLGVDIAANTGESTHSDIYPQQNPIHTSTQALAFILFQIAALPPDQRAALAALLAPQIPPPPILSNPGDRPPPN
jgi:hypothetical protein